ncbi:outer membrane protein assembly factor BamD [Pelagibacteraceae bacterium]|nr:outer membrane protein assembly factor BamD [Pelagibacteraceae bacterium]
MNNFLKIIFIVACLFLNSCSKDEKVRVIKEESLELQMIDAYKEALKAFNEQDVIYAAKRFNEAEILYPQSIWASKAALMAAYSYYSQDYFGDAIYELERFIKTYPYDSKIDYAHFLLAMCHYESIVDEKKDLRPLLKAQKKFKFIVKEYPDTDFALDSQFKLDLIFDILASKEMYIGKHYIKKEKWVAAINRYKTVVNDYGTTIYVEEALHRLVEIYYKIGLTEESKKYAALLGYNYLSGEWYKQSYRVFNKNYSNKTSKIKKKGNFITRKFKALFD